MIYEHPLAYLLGLEGVALLRSFTGEHDREFVAERIAEIRRLLDDDSLADAAVDVERVDSVTGYRTWSRTYDDGRNSAFDFDEPAVGAILDELPTGVAVDAACGTGRFAEILAGRGHRVIGVDSSPEMLARARERVPAGEFSVGELTGLPVGGAAADLVVCALALTHVPSLEPVFAEFARVLRPGGHLVISDMHPGRVMFGSVPPVRDAEGRPGRLVSHRHEIGDYLRTALPLGLQLRGYDEPGLPDQPVPPGPPPAEPGPWDF
ncbi:class I SAM-dependent methyltransferase, partial [Saccharopolyspora kobensis]